MLQGEQTVHSFKRKAVIMLSVVVAIALLLFIGHVLSKPPRESKLIENFYANQVAFEQLRNMLLADRELDGVATWGVRLADSSIERMPPDGGVPVQKYEEYLALLKAIGAKAVSRGEAPLEVRLLVWRSGFAGDSRHVAIAWKDREPMNTVNSLDEFYQTSKPRRPVYRHINGNWYIWADW
jgi:hypothetical protein